MVFFIQTFQRIRESTAEIFSEKNSFSGSEEFKGVRTWHFDSGSSLYIRQFFFLCLSITFHKPKLCVCKGGLKYNR